MAAADSRPLRPSLSLALEPAGGLPHTSAAPATFGGQSAGSLVPTAVRTAEHLEGTRRSVTLGGSLLLIPATVGLVVGAAGAVGVSGAWLALCGFLGLAAGPGMCCWALAMSNLAGKPLVRRVFLRRARAMGLTGEAAAAAWKRATQNLDDEDRERFSGRW